MPQDKKLIVDEDWKSQVQAEKEAAGHAADPAAPPAGDTADADADDYPMPPASLEMLLTTLATEALIALGQIPLPGTNEVAVRRNQAKYLIDTIELLREKTKGNVTAAESQLMETLLHQLRLAFVAVGETA